MGKNNVSASNEPGLLFYLSGENGFSADFAKGNPEPNFLKLVEVIDGGVNGGKAFQCDNKQLMAYWAPGNIYAQRGTLSFFWRSRYPVGETEFPIFRVGYADHSSWDAAWLRIDYNGGGFDAFVTDASLARTRVSYTMPSFPNPDEWVHLAFSWDENIGVKLYVNGKPAAQKDAAAVYFAGLDQFGPHSRIISPWQVQSDYNFIRGGDIDEIRVYDRMMADDNIVSLSKCQPLAELPLLARDLDKREIREEWLLRNGWNRERDTPPYLSSEKTSVRKVEIHDVYDHKRWWWKACDGIRETTWPGVYNRSRLPGRSDYFILPDWDCYSVSGKSVTFHMPDEEWNHIELSGAAWGSMYLQEEDGQETVLFDRPKDQEKTFHRIKRVEKAKKIRFENVEQEVPIGELSAYHVKQGTEPEHASSVSYELSLGVGSGGPAIDTLVQFINGRYMEDERSAMTAVPAGSPQLARGAKDTGASSLPFVHIVVPYEYDASAGLDGIAIDLPGLDVRPTHDGYFAMNIQVKDPLWYYRNMLDFSFSVKPGESRTLWLDMRDRILPAGKCLYITITGAGRDFGPDKLAGANLRLLYKPAAQAAPEHEADRFIQLKDNYAHQVEERPNSVKLNLYNRFMADLRDLLQVNPDHYLGRCYLYDKTREGKPHFAQPVPPEGMPLWAFRQAEYLRYTKRLLNWWIDKRQIENGEFGGGLSDDGDLTAWWPGPALLGCEPDKIKQSLLLEMDAFYDQGMFTNGLNTIQTDDLHTFEEGIQVLGQCLVLDFANPKHLERAMETAKAVFDLTGVNAAGHRHFMTMYYSGTKQSREDPWQESNPNSYLNLNPGYMLVRYNGNPAVKTLVVELADGLLAHFRDGVLYTNIHFVSDQDEVAANDREWPIFLAAYRFTGDEKYLAPLNDEKRGICRSSGKVDKAVVADRYAGLIEDAALREYINTEGHLWVDRVIFDLNQIQKDRLGGVAHVRFSIYPRHFVSWKFVGPANDESVAILVADADEREMRIIAYNLEDQPVHAVMTLWDIEPGTWEVVQGTDDNGDDEADTGISSFEVELERSSELQLTFPPRKHTVLRLKLKESGIPYWERPDLGIGKEDIVVQHSCLQVKIHSLGAVDTPAVRVVLKDKNGTIVSQADAPALKAPLDLIPKTAEVSLNIPVGLDLRGCYVEIDPQGKIQEITRQNNIVFL